MVIKEFYKEYKRMDDMAAAAYEDFTDSEEYFLFADAIDNLRRALENYAYYHLGYADDELLNYVDEQMDKLFAAKEEKNVD